MPVKGEDELISLFKGDKIPPRAYMRPHLFKFGIERDENEVNGKTVIFLRVDDKANPKLLFYSKLDALTDELKLNLSWMESIDVGVKQSTATEMDAAPKKPATAARLGTQAVIYDSKFKARLLAESAPYVNQELKVGDIVFLVPNAPLSIKIVTRVPVNKREIVFAEINELGNPANFMTEITRRQGGMKFNLCTLRDSPSAMFISAAKVREIVAKQIISPKGAPLAQAARLANVLVIFENKTDQLKRAMGFKQQLEKAGYTAQIVFLDKAFAAIFQATRKNEPFLAVVTEDTNAKDVRELKTRVPTVVTVTGGVISKNNFETLAAVIKSRLDAQPKIEAARLAVRVVGQSAEVTDQSGTIRILNTFNLESRGETFNFSLTNASRSRVTTQSLIGRSQEPLIYVVTTPERQNLEPVAYKVGTASGFAVAERFVSNDRLLPGSVIGWLSERNGERLDLTNSAFKVTAETVKSAKTLRVEPQILESVAQAPLGARLSSAGLQNSPPVTFSAAAVLEQPQSGNVTTNQNIQIFVAGVRLAGVSLNGKKASINDEQKRTAIYSFEDNGNTVTASSASGANFTLTLDQARAITGDTHGKREAVLNQAAVVQAVEAVNRSVAGDLEGILAENAAGATVLKISTAWFPFEITTSGTKIIPRQFLEYFVTVARLASKTYARNTTFIIEGDLRDQVLNFSGAEGLFLAEAVVPEALKGVPVVSVSAGLKQGVRNILVSKLGLGEVPALDAIFRLAQAAGFVDPKHLPTAFLNAWSTLAGHMVNSQAVSLIMQGLVDLITALKDALSPVAAVGWEVAARAYALMKRMIGQSV